MATTRSESTPYGINPFAPSGSAESAQPTTPSLSRTTPAPQGPPGPASFLMSRERYLSRLPHPCAIWIDPEMTWSDRLPQSPALTASDFLRSLAPEFGPYFERQHATFLEVTWGRPDRIESLRRNMKTTLPPLMLVADDERQLPAMLQALTGVSIRFASTPMIARDRPVPGSPDEMALFRSFDFYSYLVDINLGEVSIFTNLTPAPFERVMDSLAARFGLVALDYADHWELGLMPDVSIHSKAVPRWIEALRQDPCGGANHEAGRALLRIGRAAVPELLAELQRADDYEYLTLVKILERLPSTARDRVFIEQLRKRGKPGVASGGDFLDHATLSVMIRALGENRCADAAPVIRDLAANPGLKWDVREAARIALDQLDAPLPPRHAVELFVRESDFLSTASESLIHSSTDILACLADRDLLWTSGTLRLRSVESNPMGGATLRGTLPDGEGLWRLETARPTGDKTPVFYWYYRGNVWSAANFGLLEPSPTGRKVRFWIQLYIS